MTTTATTEKNSRTIFDESLLKKNRFETERGQSTCRGHAESEGRDLFDAILARLRSWGNKGRLLKRIEIQ